MSTKIATLVLFLAVIAITITTTEVYADRKSADEKADDQADKDHIKQADHTCEKAGYDGYINENCGYLN